MSKLHQIAPEFVAFHCPGCKYGHAVTVNGHRNSSGATWSWNGSMNKPTFSPSINCNPNDDLHRCHSFVRDGMIQFLSDSWHKLKGQTVEIPEWGE